ncbi:MAG TPA: Crp/Fnr family transcriptional regulator [Tissierellales bacterium]|nr:Crp/Fnr family transcriptional regulator [Tissierellales bacterium]
MEIKNIIETNFVLMDMLKDCPYSILKRWEMKSYSKGDMICHQNMTYDYFYVIIKGKANIYIMAENGKKYSQSIYEKGDYFGELEIFDRKPYICSVEAITNLELIRLHRNDFLQWIEKDRYFSLYMAKTLCDGFYALSKKAGEDTLYSLKYRICNYIISSMENGTEKPNGIEITFDKEQLSNQFVVTQRSINRILQQLKEKNLIEVYNNNILIKDLEGLQEEKSISKNE